MKNITNQIPSENVKAKVIVEGLFVFCINEEAKQAEFGVYDFADDHEFSIKISKKPFDITADPIREIIELTSDPIIAYLNNLSIGIKGRASDVQIYQNENLEESYFFIKAREEEIETEDENGNSTGYEKDFRWVLDLESSRFHNERLNIVPGMLERKIIISNGVISTHDTGGRIVKNTFPSIAKQKPPLDSCYVSYQLAIDLIADPLEESIVISYRDQNATRRNEICLVPSDEYYYEIKLDNNCKRAKPNARFSDFQHYYNVFANVTADNRFDFEKFDGSGTKSIPCDLVFLGQHQSLDEIKEGLVEMSDQAITVTEANDSSPTLQLECQKEVH
ncbi:MAG: hypothetical protein JST85_09275 [Acidobacteria bacterium]|nr:hypothetical protein [Acidobacteriota bacterium]